MHDDHDRPDWDMALGCLLIEVEAEAQYRAALRRLYMLTNVEIPAWLKVPSNP